MVWPVECAGPQPLMQQRPQACTCMGFGLVRFLAATPAISVDFSSSGYLMFQFPGCLLAPYFIQARVAGHDPCWVPPFGDLRIEGRLRLPGAYRSLPRPSSTSCAKASAVPLTSSSHNSGFQASNTRCSRDRDDARSPAARRDGRVKKIISHQTLCNCQGAREAEAPRGRARKPDAETAGAKRPGDPRNGAKKIVFVVSRRGALARPSGHVCVSLRKEVIQPHLPVRLPLYDFTPLPSTPSTPPPLAGSAGGFGVQTTRVV